MKLIQELLEMQQIEESITFGPAELDMSDPKYPKGIYSGAKWWRKEKVDCFVCDGAGHEKWGGYKDRETGKDVPETKEQCRMCNGEGKIDDTKSDAPEMNVANGNALDLVTYLGIGGDDDYSGSVAPKDLPALRRKLIKMKNGDADDLVKDTEVSHNPRTVRTKDDDGMDRIERRGAKMIDMGRSPDQVMRYVDQLLKIIDFCQKNDAHLTWG